MLQRHGEESSRKLAARLAKIEGHTRAIAEMIRDERDCVEVLHQIRSVVGAWQQLGNLILDEHLRQCIKDAVERGKVDEAMSSLREALVRM